jgi:aldose 1-epimerase
MIEPRDMLEPLGMIELSDGSGLEARLSPWGATLVSLRAPDREGRTGEVVLGFDSERDYRGIHPHFGGTIGRYANRIAGGRFELDGRVHRLACNDPPNHLHGGPGGFDRVVWSARSDGRRCELRYTSPDGEEGYPGRLDVDVVYTLAEAALRIDLGAESDAPTVVNLTHHSYFNLLNGGGGSDVLDHELWIAAEHYTQVRRDGIPTGEILPVAGTPLDFRAPTRIGARLERLADGRGGYDHNFVLERSGAGLELAARVLEPRSGRTLEVHTTQPGLQLYGGQFLDGSLRGRGGVAYERFAGLCLEPQHFPDSPNRPGFPSTRLEPGERWEHTILYRLGVA